MKLLQSRLIGLSFVILSLVITLLWVTNMINQHMQEAFVKLSHDYTYTLKRKNIKEIVYSVHSIVEQGLKDAYIAQQLQLQKEGERLGNFLARSAPSTWCQQLNTLLPPKEMITFELLSNTKQSLCKTANLSKKPLTTDTPDIQNDLLVATAITPYATLLLHYPKEQLYIKTKEKMGHIIKTMTFADPNRYVWVKEILDYNGGDHYAIRRIHSALPQTEGKVLSTLDKDIKGNLRFQTELEGLKREGEVYFDYYFTKKTTQTTVHKLGFSKLFKPFNWAIGTGVYLDDVNGMIMAHNAQIDAELLTYRYLLIFTALILAGLCILFLYKKESNEIALKEKNLNLSYKKEKLKNYQQVLYSMLDLVEKRDTYTAGHTQRVATYAVLIAHAMKLPQDDIDTLYEASIMHDIGKIATPDAILLKPGRLSEHEYKIIQNHLNVGHGMLASMKAFTKHAEIMRNHHERYDGKGYPRGLKGEEIPLLSHILILADAFDAMTSQRIYRARKSLNAALNEILTLKGTQFSPQVVDVAYIALKQHGIIPAQHNYLSDTLEEARVAFYYKDPLTGLYNYHYLDQLLHNALMKESHGYRSCYFVSLRNFSHFNARYGWLEGDHKLCDIAGMLKTCYPNGLIFRIFGDDFLILHKDLITIEKQTLLSQRVFDNTNIEIDIEHFDLQESSIHTFADLTTHIAQRLHA